jgi:hypothetical protein
MSREPYDPVETIRELTEEIRDEIAGTHEEVERTRRTFDPRLGPSPLVIAPMAAMLFTTRHGGSGVHRVLQMDQCVEDALMLWERTTARLARRIESPLPTGDAR